MIYCNEDTVHQYSCLVVEVEVEVVLEPPLICLAGAHLGLAGQRTERTERTEVPQRPRLTTFLSVCNQQPLSSHLTPRTILFNTFNKNIIYYVIVMAIETTWCFCNDKRFSN